jgi:serine O-acetyltransferase
MIGNGLLLPHPIGIIIGDDIIIGNNVTIGQFVTLGGNFKKTKIYDNQTRKTPIIFDRVWLSAGSVIAGPIAINSDTIIGANSVITKDIPPNCIVNGNNNIIETGIRVELDGSFTRNI